MFLMGKAIGASPFCPPEPILRIGFNGELPRAYRTGEALPLVNPETVFPGSNRDTRSVASQSTSSSSTNVLDPRVAESVLFGVIPVVPLNRESPCRSRTISLHSKSIAWRTSSPNILRTRDS